MPVNCSEGVSIELSVPVFPLDTERDEATVIRLGLWSGLRVYSVACLYYWKYLRKLSLIAFNYFKKWTFWVYVQVIIV